MKINPSGLPDIPAPGSGADKVRPQGRAEGSAPAPAFTVAPASDAPRPLQSAALQPAMQALGAMPEIDQARIDALREAIGRGEIRFDSAKLAGLITRYHGGRG